MKKLIFFLLVIVLSVSLASCDINQKQENDGTFLESIFINNDSITLEVGATDIINVVASPESAIEDDLRFKSSDESIVTVDKKTGEITAIAEGSAKITAYSKTDSDIKYVCTVTVIPHQHMPDYNTVKDNRVESTCAKAGSYDEITYCVYENCKQEISRETKILKKAYHSYVNNVCQECGQVASDGLEYTLSEDGEYYYVTGLGTCTDIDIVIPDRYNDIEVRYVYKISREGEHIRSFTIPATVLYFECDYGFTGNVEKITVEESNESYKTVNGVIYSADMTRLVACPPKLATAGFTIPDTVKIIGSYAFAYTSIPNIEIPSSVEEIGNGAFSSSLVQNMIIDCKADRLLYGTFSGCYNLTSVTLGKNIKTIDEGAFRDCTNLVEIVNLSDLDLTKGSEDHGSVALYAKSITNATPEESIVDDVEGFFFVTEDGINYLIGCSREMTIVLPDNYKGEPYVITKDAFATVEKAISITIGSGVSHIEEGAFSHFYGLAEVINRSSINITNSYEDGTYYVYAIIVHSGESKIREYQSCYFITDDYGNNYLVSAVGIGINTHIVLPDYYYGATYEIREYAFYNNNYIESVVIGEGVTTIGFDAFSFCRSLRSITIKDGVKRIDPFAFSGCSFESLDIPNSVECISDEAFGYNKRLRSVSIGSGVNDMSNAFAGCDNLKLVTITALNPNFKTVDSVIYTYDGKTLVAYPAGKTNASFTIPDGVEIIGSRAFYMVKNLKHIIISDSVKSIKASVFYQCTGIETLVFGSSLEEIHSWAFYDVDPHSILWKSQNASLDLSIFSTLGDTNVYFTGTEEEWNAFVSANPANSDYLHYLTIFYNQTQLP